MSMISNMFCLLFWSENPIENFFGQARQRMGGNFSIDICDVMAAGKVLNLHQLIKYDIVPDGNQATDCEYCNMIPISVDLELVSNLAITDTQTLLESTDILKEKVVFITGYLSRKHFQEGEIEDEELVTSDFLKELSRGGLRVPTSNMVLLVHSAMSMYETLKEPYRSYF